jgi:hypothetical protein
VSAAFAAAAEAAGARQLAVVPRPPDRRPVPAAVGENRGPLLLHFSFCCGIGIAAAGVRAGGAKVVMHADYSAPRVTDFAARFGIPDAKFSVTVDLFPRDPKEEKALARRLKALVTEVVKREKGATSREVFTFAQISPSCKQLSAINRSETGDVAEIEMSMRLLDAIGFDFGLVECVREGTKDARLASESWKRVDFVCCEYGAPQTRPRAFWASPPALADAMLGVRGKLISSGAVLCLPPDCQIGSPATNVALGVGVYRTKRPDERRRPQDMPGYTLTSKPPRLYFKGDERVMGTGFLFSHYSLMMNLPASFGPASPITMEEMRVGVADGIPAETMAWWTTACFAVLADRGCARPVPLGARPQIPTADGRCCAAAFCGETAAFDHPLWPFARVCRDHERAADPLRAEGWRLGAGGKLAECVLCGSRGARDVPQLARQLGAGVSRTSAEARAAMLVDLLPCARCHNAVCRACSYGNWQGAPLVWAEGAGFECPSCNVEPYKYF